MPTRVKKVTAKDIRNTVGKRLPIKSDRALNDILDYAADSKAEAYRIGAEEAQGEILARLRPLLERMEAQHG